jgi:tetrahydromethanopterin S-methyltransferase subunit B
MWSLEVIPSVGVATSSNCDALFISFRTIRTQLDQIDATIFDLLRTRAR